MVRKSFIAALLAILSAVVGGSIAQAEGRRPCPAEIGCQTKLGTYQVRLPSKPMAGRSVGAIVYFHGYQGTGAEVLEDLALAQIADALGVAIIAPDGLGKSWSFPGSPSTRRDEFAFVADVIQDSTARFGIDPRRLMATGFSQGGSMVWFLACRMPTDFAAFAPIAGAFWEPIPSRCSEPRPPMMHFHGVADGTVPMAGRQLRQGWRQGDLFRSLAVFAPGGCTAGWEEMARAVGTSPSLTCRRATSCGKIGLELCLHAGGHHAEAEWVRRAWLAMMPE